MQNLQGPGDVFDQFKMDSTAETELDQSLVRAYHHKTVPVSAVRLTADNVVEVARWCHGTIVEEIDPHDPEVTFVGINYPTRIDGRRRVSEGQILVRNERGSFVTHNAGYFNLMYIPS